MTRYQNTISAAIALAALNCVALGKDKPQASFSRVIELVASNNRQAAKQEMDQIPDAELIQDGLAFLRENSALSDDIRQYCFKALAQRAAANTDEGYNLFIDGLLDPTVRRWSVAGLTHVPEERRRETVEHLLRVSNLADTTGSKNVIVRALGILERWGKTAAAVLPQVEQIFHNSRYSDGERSLAALTMLSIGSSERAVDQFEKENVGLCLGAIGEAAYVTNGSFNTDNATRTRIRQLVQKGLRSTDLDIRNYAFEALLPAYSHDFLVEDEQGGFRANPEVVRVLSEFVANEADAPTRRRAQSALETMDQRVKNAVRKRTKRAAAQGSLQQ